MISSHSSPVPQIRACILSRFGPIWLFATLWLFCPWDSAGKNIGVGCHALLPTQDSNPCLLDGRRILYPLSHLHHACCHLIDAFFLLKCPDVQLNKWISFFLLFFLFFLFPLSFTLNLGIGFNKYTCIFFSLKWKSSVLGVGEDGFSVYSVYPFCLISPGWLVYFTLGAVSTVDAVSEK